MDASNTPRGVAEQTAAVEDLFEEAFNPKPDEPREDKLADGEGAGPEQAALGESLEEGAVEAGGEAAAAKPEDAGGEEIRTIADFAKAAGWEASDLYALSMKLDTGEEVSLGQIKDKLQAHARQEAELAAQRDALAQEQQLLRSQAQQLMQGQQQLSEAALEARGRMVAVQERYNEVDWERLKEADPGRYAALQQDFAVAYSGAKNALAQAMQQQQVVQQQYWNRSLVENDQRFLSVVPEWKDEKVAAREGPEISKFLMDTIGFRPDELTAIFDARARVVGRMAWLWHQHQQKVAAATSKVRQAPKPVLRPGSGGVPGTVQTRRVSELEQRAKTTGSRRDQESAVAAILSSL
jgi:hypothetical protein